MFKSKFSKALLFIVLIWLAVTVYFYFQHQVTIQTQVLDKKEELENADVVVKELLLMDVENKNFDFDNWRYSWAEKLPPSMVTPFLKICHFYSKPYQEIPYDASKIELRGMVVLNEEIEQGESLWDYYEIEIMDEEGVRYGSGYKLIYEGGKIYYFAVNGNCYNRDLAKVDIVITDKSSGNIKTLPVEINWQAEKYNYFNRPPLNLEPHRLHD